MQFMICKQMARFGRHFPRPALLDDLSGNVDGIPVLKGLRSFRMGG